MFYDIFTHSLEKGSPPGISKFKKPCDKCSNNFNSTFFYNFNNFKANLIQSSWNGSLVPTIILVAGKYFNIYKHSTLKN